ncbi:MAG: hypothetical protein WA177_03020 [Xanthobacteraceae bacterium]|jgi:hypothetical protein
MRRFISAGAAIGVAALGLAIGGLAVSEKPAVAYGTRPAQSATMCAQVISCGTKDGKVREYPTPCAAKDDGATDVHPKAGASCETGK